MPGRRPSLALVFTVTVTGVLNNTLVTPAIPDILSDLGQPAGRAGLLVAAGAAAGVVVAPLIGFLADRYGRRPVLITCLVMFGIFGTASAFAPTFELLVASRFLQSMGTAGLINLAVVLIGDHWEGTERTKLVGRNSAALTAALAILPLISGVVTELAGWRVTFGLYSLAFLVAAWAWADLRPARPERTIDIRSQLGGAWEVLRRPPIITTYVTGFFAFVAVFGMMLTALPVHLAEEFDLGPAARGLVIALPAVTSSIAAFNLGRLRTKRGVAQIVAVTAIGFAVAFLAMGLGGLAVVVAAVLLYGLSEGAMIPALQDVGVSDSPDEQRGAVVAVWVGFVRFGQTVGSLLAGTALAAVGAGSTLMLGAVVAGIIFAVSTLGALPRTALGSG